jgi:RecA/RadA recombinase
VALQKDPWRPVLDKLLSTRERMGQCRCPGVRSKETGLVTDFLLDKALHPTGGVIYLCGLPGTGKTEVAKAAIQKMNATLREKGMSRVPKAAVISCSTFKQDPESLWTTAYRQLHSVTYQHGEGDQAEV